jgi:two-component system, OmpR family, KDP operon response regulator KdpE
MNIGPLRILVVDDEPAILRFLRAGLSHQGYIVIEAETGRAALDQIRRKAAHMMVLDLGLPDIDGLEVIRAVRATDSVLPILGCPAARMKMPRSPRWTWVPTTM